MENLTVGQELEFDVYGNQVKGKFLSIPEVNVIEVEIISDSSFVSKAGEKCRLHKSYLCEPTPVPRLTKKAIISRDNEIIIDLEQLKIEARHRNDEATAQKLDGVIFRLLCLTNEA